MITIDGTVRNKALGWIAVATTLIAPARAWSYGSGGNELHELYHGARPLAMGGAFTAVADDENAIWYNAAGLAGIESTTFHVVPLNLELSSGFIGDSSLINDFKGASADSVNALMGKSAYTRAQLTPSFVMPHFGVSAIVDGQAALYARNQALPQMNIGYQNTNGVQAAFGIAVGNPGRRNRKKHEFRIGGAAKMLFRRGGYRLLSDTEILNLSPNTLGQITGNYEKGYGADLGTQYVFRPNSRLELKAGLAWTDIGDTSFGTMADPIKSNLSVGVAATYSWGLTKATVAYDYRHIQADTDGRKKSHLGFEFALPVVSIYAGLNQIYFTYGASVDLAIVKVTALSYAEEQASNAAMDPDRRYMLAFDFKLGI